MAACSLIPVTSEDDFNSQTAALPPTCLAVIYFHAPWAEPCKQMNTILTTLASTYEITNPPRIAFFSLDAEELSEVSETYDVTQVPLVVLQRDGKVVDAVTGTDAAKVRGAVEKHAGSSTGGNKASLPPAQKVTRPAAEDTAADTNGTTHGAAAEEEENLDERLAQLVKAADVMLFMKGTPSAPQCGFSRQTVSILRQRKIKYGFFNILADDDVRQGLKKFSDWPTFPQIYVQGELIGGLDILKEELDNDPDFLKPFIQQPQAV
ncbi:thioredoxin-like protein [Neohortaea acidophila]|uniref:Thioredoxin-like protein n=1 Tax=Neohortaea acidophila TaxID=245834 RepID=A0A6A6PK38_9PEZI|nr:thioredoxin-like protein [Neohortaea acidophila]KAF2480379.1 thioredoxin-like protein [Neohortaea acidophila]